MIKSIFYTSGKYPPPSQMGCTQPHMYSYFCGCKFIHIFANVLLYPKALSNTNTTGNIHFTNKIKILYEQQRGCRPLDWQQYSIPKKTARRIDRAQRNILKNICIHIYKQIYTNTYTEDEQKILFTFYATLENMIAVFC